MDEIDSLKAAANSLLEKARNGPVSDLASAVEKATGVFKLSADLEKSKAEVGKLALEETKLRYENDIAPKRERSGRIKEYVALLTPFVSIVALAATLMLQGAQFWQSEKDKREATEDAQWDAALKLVAQSSNVSPTVITLNPFLNSTKYRDLARDTAVQLLANSTDKIFFTDLFGAAFVPVGWNNLNQLIKLDKALAARVEPLAEKSYDAKTNLNDFTKLSPQEKQAYDYITDVLPTISAQVASVLKAPRVNDSMLDLSATRFKSSDWGGADLSGANIESIALEWVDLKGANLDNITQFEGALFTHVAWWEAKEIGPKLREYLETNDDARFKSGWKYGLKNETFTQQQYDAALNRLKHPTP
jgi:hypothetical protein